MKEPEPTTLTTQTTSQEPRLRGDLHRLSKRAERMLLTAILIVAALLRLGWPGIIQFSQDEAQTVGLALDVVERRGIPLFGTGTSFGLPTSPISEYVYVPAALLSPDPLWLAWYTGALNLVALALFWRFSRRCWGPQVAICATLLFATHPWAAMSSRRTWEPDLLAVFSIPWAITGELAFHQRKPKALAAHLALLSVVAQLHYSGLALLPVTGFMLILARKHLDRRMLVAGLVLAAVIAMPFVYGTVRTLGQGWQTALDFISGPARVDMQSPRLWWVTATGSDVHSLAGWSAYRYFVRSLPNLDLLRLALGTLVLAGIGLWLQESTRAGLGLTPTPGTLVALWALSPLLLLLRHTRPLYLHYYVVSLPALSLAAGFALGRLLVSRQSWRRHVAGALVIAIGLAQVVTTVSILRFVGGRATPGGFGVPLQSQSRAARRSIAAGPPVIVLSDGDDPRLSTWAAVFGVHLRRVPHRIVDGRRLVLFPGRDTTVLVTPGAEAALQAYSDSGLLDHAEVILNRNGEEPFRVLRLRAGRMPRLQQLAKPRRLANGAEIVGYRVEGAIKPGHAFDWWIAWRVWHAPPSPHGRYHIFNHVVDAEGARLTQADGPTMSTRDWSVGDLILQRFRMGLPADARDGPVWIRVGMYTYPQLQNQAVLDADGQPASEFVTLGPLPAN